VNDAVKSGLVSVVVASYNHAEFLGRRMESLINQTYRNIEILVIDDCSTDNSVAVLQHYKSHPNVNLVLREKNGGWVTVSNQGIEMSTGEFILFANCDDSCDIRMIERLVQAMQTYPGAGIAFCRSLLIDEHDKVLGNDFMIRESSFRSRCSDDTLIAGDEMARFLMHSCVIPNLSAALFRKECFSAVGKLSSSYRVCCDWDLFFRVVSRFDVAYLTEPLNYFRQHETTIRSATKQRVVYEEYFRLLLGQIKTMKLTAMERLHFRTHVMSIWAVHLISPSIAGLVNFPYHLKRVFSLDPITLPLLIPALLLRIVHVIGKALYNLHGRKGAARKSCGFFL
jgi:glycosyltransferase involved in cell wall biosynthesis